MLMFIAKRIMFFLGFCFVFVRIFCFSWCEEVSVVRALSEVSTLNVQDVDENFLRDGIETGKDMLIRPHRGGVERVWCSHRLAFFVGWRGGFLMGREASIMVAIKASCGTFQMRKFSLVSVLEPWLEKREATVDCKAPCGMEGWLLPCKLEALLRPYLLQHQFSLASSVNQLCHWSTLHSEVLQAIALKMVRIQIQLHWKSWFHVVICFSFWF